MTILILINYLMMEILLSFVGESLDFIDSEKMRKLGCSKGQGVEKGFPTVDGSKRQKKTAKKFALIAIAENFPTT